MHPIDKAMKDKAELSAQYNVPVTSIVWKGDNKYIIAFDNGKTMEV